MDGTDRAVIDSLLGKPSPEESRRRLLKGLFGAGLGAVLLCILVQWARGALAGMIWALLWYSNLVLRGFHQSVFWILFLCVAGIIASISLLRGFRLPRARPRKERPPASRLARMAQAFHLADRGQYFRWSLARELSLLTLDALGCDPDLESGPRRQWLNNPQLDIPPEIRAYVDAALWGSYAEQAAHRPPRLLRALSRAPNDSPIGLDPTHVIQYLEKILEVTNDPGLT
jgi:hypothetical protein